MYKNMWNARILGMPPRGEIYRPFIVVITSWIGLVRMNSTVLPSITRVTREPLSIWKWFDFY
jgi:hypothetical protein